MTTADRNPRKVIVATAMFGPYGRWPGLGRRLAELEELVEGMVRHAEARYPSRGIDLAVLPEDAVCGGRPGSAAERSVPLCGEVLERLGGSARRHGLYLVAPLFRRAEDGTCSNAAALLGRNGEVVGIYRKIHPVLGQEGDLLEGGVVPGEEAPAFVCDFGRVGIQICFDMTYDDGWDALKRGGAEIVAWPTQSPQTARPASRARQGRCWVVSSTWRNNLCLFEPTGMIAARVDEPGRCLVQEIDLSYALLPWSGPLRNGQALFERFGARVGGRYYESEDCGIFWSNDPDAPLAPMLRELGLEEELDGLAARNRAAREAMAGPVR
ncbi:MAG: carbon-nitrogen hydrolase family protein [Gemmatimonadota bacterium]